MPGNYQLHSSSTPKGCPIPLGKGCLCCLSTFWTSVSRWTSVGTPSFNGKQNKSFPIDTGSSIWTRSVFKKPFLVYDNNKYGKAVMLGPVKVDKNMKPNSFVETEISCNIINVFYSVRMQLITCDYFHSRVQCGRMPPYILP